MLANINKIQYTDSTNTVGGLATSVWFNGCPFECIGCHNDITWTEVNFEYVHDIIDNIQTPTHLSLLGGEPLADDNIEATKLLIELFKRKYPKKHVFVWTGYSLLQSKQRLGVAYRHITFLKVGLYRQDLKINGRFYGSSNQHAYLLEQGQLLMVWDEDNNKFDNDLTGEHLW